MKSGIYTTEFWQTIGTQIITLLVLFHIVPTTVQADLMTSLSNAVIAISALVGNIFVVIHYIKSRSAVKTNGTAS